MFELSATWTLNDAYASKTDKTSHLTCFLFLKYFFCPQVYVTLEIVDNRDFK